MQRATIAYEVARQAHAREPSQTFQNQLETLAHQTRMALGAHQCAISYLPLGDFKTAIHAVSLSDKYAKYRSYDVTPTGQGIWSLVLRSRAGVCMTESEMVSHPLWANFSNLRDARGLEHPPMRGWLAAPVMRADGQVLGLLHLSDKFDDADFTGADLDSLVQLANMVLPTFELQFANQQLRDITNELEERVRERTSELQRANEKLQQRTNRFELVASGACDAIWDWNIREHRVYYSARWKQLRGYSAEEIRDREDEWFAGIHEEDRERVLSAISHHFMGQTPFFEEEYRVRCKEGSWKWIHDRGLALRDDSGQPIRMAGSASDITERRLAEEALRWSESRFRILVEHSPDAIVVFDVDLGTFVEANPKACSLFQLDRNELLKHGPLELSPATQPKGRSSLEYGSFLIEEAIADRPTRFEWIHKNTLGHDIPCEVYLIRLPSADRRLIRASLVDITDRKQAERALRLSEQRFRDLFENSPDAIFVEDFEGKVVDANSEACKLHGLESNDLIGCYFHQLVPPEHREAAREQFYRMTRGELRHFESQSYTADGRVIPVEIRANLIQLEGQPRLLLQVRDISARHQAEAKLRLSEGLFRSVVEGSLHGILIHQDECIQFVNPALVAMFGYEQYSELVGRNLLEAIIAPEDRLLLRERIAASYEGRPLAPSRPWKGLRKDGSKFWIVSTSSPVVWKGRAAIVAFLLNVDDRKQAEDANEQSRRMLQLVLDHIPQGVFWKDRESRLLGCNRIVAQAHGFHSPSQMIGLADHQLPGVTLEQAQQYVSKDREVMETNSPIFDHLESLTLADGRLVWLETTKVPLQNSAGEVVGVLGTWQDVTQRRKTEEERQRFDAQLQHTQKLESLGVLAGGIAHDFNNLLTSILGYADLALLELPQASIARDHILSAADGARRAAELTNQMLAYSGKGRFVVEPINLSTIVDNLARLLQISISKKCVMKFNMMANLPSIEADAAQIRQVVMNLIINASESIGERSGVIALTTGTMHCDRAYFAGTYLNENLEPGMYVYLEVADNGCGMSEETQSRIFDPFFTTKFTGRGLGLSAVLGIVRGHRGAIKCYSELGKGTTFKVLFPAVAISAHEAAAANAAEKHWRGSGLALVVDDEESIRAMVRRMLEAMGFKVLTAADGREGVEVYRQNVNDIQFVILDMTMPRLDGEETFREMRRIRSDVKAILTSGYNEQTATSRFAGKGLAAFIQKPYGFSELREVVQNVMAEVPKSG